MWPHVSEDGTLILFCLFVNVFHYIRKIILDSSLRAGIAEII
jgi:hypothetical protein